MAVNLSPIGGVAAQFFDNNGDPLSGGKIYTYAAGTTTPLPTYTTSSSGVPHANPIILDAAGRVPGGEIWLTDGLQYKFIIKTSTDVQIGSYDNIIGINSNFVNYTNSQEIQTATAGQTVFTLTTMSYQPATNSLSVFVDGVNQYGPGALYAYQETSSTVVTFTSGLHVGASVKFVTSAINASSYGDAEQISYTTPYTGGATTNVEVKLAQNLNVADFGAVGNGTANDTAAIQAAVNAAATAGGVVNFPRGTFMVSGISLPDNVVLAGAGKDITTLKLIASSNANIVQKAGGAAGRGSGLRDMTLDGNDQNNTTGGLYWAGANTGRGFSFFIERVTVTNCRPVSGSTGIFPAVLLTGNQFGYARDVDLVNNNYAQAALSLQCSDWEFSDLYIGQNGLNYSGPTSYGLVIIGGGNRFSHCYFGGTQLGAQVYIYGGSANKFTNCVCDNSGTDGVFLQDFGASQASNNIWVGGQIGNSSFSFGGTYYTIRNGSQGTNNIFANVDIYSNYATAYATNAYFEDPGVSGGNYLVGCVFAGTWTGGVDGRTTNSTTYITACRGFDVSDFNTVLAKQQVNVEGPYTAGVPSTSVTPLGRFNGGGAISLWVGQYAYNSMWLQSIQDDGTNNNKELTLNPLGGTVSIGGNGNGLKLTSPNGLVTKTITINNAGSLVLI